MKSKKFNIILPIYLGTILEWYDFSIYAFLTPLLAMLFFPSENKLLSTLMAYAIFAIGFIIRPLGGAFFGRYGDKNGRKKSMMRSMILITLSTTMIGFLPTYQSVGVIAPIALILLRMIQGFCVGGESTGAPLYIIEMYPLKFRGALGSFMWTAAGFGMLAGSLLSTVLMNQYSMSQLTSGYWRIPFLLSILTGLVSLYFRSNIPETTLYQNKIQTPHKTRTPLSTVFKKHKGAVLKIISLYGLSSVITYILFVFMPVYMNMYNGMDLKRASLITTLALTTVTFFVPLSGYISDLIGRKICLYIGSIGFLCVSTPLFLYMNTVKSLYSFILSDSIFVLLAIFYQGGLTSAVQESVNTNNRFLLTSVGYNISYGLIGGSSPLLVTWISDLLSCQIIPGLYLTFFAFLAVITVFSMQETYKLTLK